LRLRRASGTLADVKLHVVALACVGLLAGCGDVATAPDAGEPGFHVEAAVCNELPIAGASVAVETRPGFPAVPTIVRYDPPDGTYVLTSYVAFDGDAHPSATSRTLVVEGLNWHMARTDDGGPVVHVDYEYLGPGVPEEGSHRLFTRCGPGPNEPLETYPDGNGFLVRTDTGGPVSVMRYIRIH